MGAEPPPPQSSPEDTRARSPSLGETACFGTFRTAGDLGLTWRGTSEGMIAARRVSLVGLLWIVIGVIVAVSRDYFDHLQTAAEMGSALLAVLAWPLVLLNVHIGI